MLLFWDSVLHFLIIIFVNFTCYSKATIRDSSALMTDTSYPKSVLNKGCTCFRVFLFLYRQQSKSAFSASEHKILLSSKGISSINRGRPGLKRFVVFSSTEAGQAGLEVKQLARCFPSPLERAVLGLNSAAWGELPATGLQGAALWLSTEW